MGFPGHIFSSRGRWIGARLWGWVFFLGGGGVVVRGFHEEALRDSVGAVAGAELWVLVEGVTGEGWSGVERRWAVDWLVA